MLNHWNMILQTKNIWFILQIIVIGILLIFALMFSLKDRVMIFKVTLILMIKDNSMLF